MSYIKSGSEGKPETHKGPRDWSVPCSGYKNNPEKFISGIGIPTIRHPHNPGSGGIPPASPRSAPGST